MNGSDNIRMPSTPASRWRWRSMRSAPRWSGRGSPEGLAAPAEHRGGRRVEGADDPHRDKIRRESQSGFSRGWGQRSPKECH